MALVKVTLETTLEISNDELQRRTASGVSQLVNDLIKEWLGRKPQPVIEWLVEERPNAVDSAAA